MGFSVSFSLQGSRINESHTLFPLCDRSTEAEIQKEEQGPCVQKLPGSWGDEADSWDREAQRSGHSLSKYS